MYIPPLAARPLGPPKKKEKERNYMCDRAHSHIRVVQKFAMTYLQRHDSFSSKSVRCLGKCVMTVCCGKLSVS